jgi:hypothetical protein
MRIIFIIFTHSAISDEPQRIVPNKFDPKWSLIKICTTQRKATKKSRARPSVFLFDACHPREVTPAGHLPPFLSFRAHIEVTHDVDNTQ